MKLFHTLYWKHWGLRTRLVLIAVFPVAYLFFSVVSYSYYAGSREVDNELHARANTIVTALVDGVEPNLRAQNIDGLKQTISSVIQSDDNIFRIEVLDANRLILSSVDNPGKVKADAHFIEKPVLKKMVWVKLLPVDGKTITSAQDKASADEQSKSAVLAYVKVTMTDTYLLAKQRHRFAVELMMSLLALSMSVFLAYLLSGSLTRPLRAAIKALRDIRGGDTRSQLSITTGGEIGQLQQSINEMAQRLFEHQQHLENKVEERTRELILSRNEALKADAEKRKLIHQVNTIVEVERQSIAVEIHDELNASLIAIRLQAEQVLRLSGKAAQESQSESNLHAFKSIQESARSMVKLALDLYANGRNLVRRLRPEVLELMGLQGAVEEMIRVNNAAQSNCVFYFSCEGDARRLSHDVAISVYRIVQEASSNVLKHAKASRVDIRLELREDEANMRLTVEDDGQGFDPMLTPSGIGITGMRERVLVLGGQFNLDSAPGLGTRMCIALSL